MKLRTIKKRISQNASNMHKALMRVRNSHYDIWWEIGSAPIAPYVVIGAIKERYPSLQLPRKWLDRIRRAVKGRNYDKSK